MDGAPVPTPGDVIGTINGLPYVWSLLLDGLPAGAAAVARVHLAGTLDRLGRPVGSADVDGPDLLIPAARTTAARVREMTERERVGLLDAVTADVLAAGRAIVAAGAGAERRTGRVDAISVSDGGVPKSAIERSAIGPRGLSADQQNSRVHHGKPMQAVCIYASEVIAALQAEGHPIAAGATGENLTVSGLDWASLRPGSHLLVGSALLAFSAPATPCDKNAAWFLDGDYDRMSHADHPGWSRWYTWVLRPGEVAVGDAVVVEPD